MQYYIVILLVVFLNVLVRAQRINSDSLDQENPTSQELGNERRRSEFLGSNDRITITI